MSDMELYASYFSPGMKVGVVIPMANAENFRDWAIIHGMEEDLVTLQLSRDQLPEGVTLHVGQILEVRGGRDGVAYSCRAIIVEEGESREVLLRLIGEIVTDELREFYRIDAFLPIKFWISAEQHPDVLEREWVSRHRQRLDDEMNRKQERWDTLMKQRVEITYQDDEESHPETPVEPEEADPTWDSVIPLAANISGGGIRIVCHHEFTAGEYVPLEILVPAPRRIVDAVGKVMFINRNTPRPGERESFSVALKFVFVDERDRDAIVNHIAHVQLQRIRQLREQFSLVGGYYDGEEEGNAARRRIRNIVLGIVFVGILLVIVDYFRGYVANRPKGEIAETFEQGLKRYIERIGGRMR